MNGVDGKAVSAGEPDRDELDGFIEEEELRDLGFRSAYQDAMARSGLLRELIRQRHERRVSQVEVAARMGTTQSAVSDLERGTTDPRLSTLQRYAAAVGCRLYLVLRQPDRHTMWRQAMAGPSATAELAAEPERDSFWRQLASLLRDVRAQRTGHSESALTYVAPVELREDPDEFARAARR